MHSYNFFGYTKEAEEPGGDYWKLLDATSQKIEDDNITFFDINDIFKGITNDELKSKIKKKIFNLIMERDLYFQGADRALDLFDSDELKQIFEHELDITIKRYSSDPSKIKQRYNDSISLIRLFNKANDENWDYSMTIKIIDNLKDLESKVPLVNTIESTKKNIKKYDKLIKYYYEYLPNEYKNYIKIDNDSNYIQNKSLGFMDIDIGIDPRITIGPEIEANNDYNIHIDLVSQNGFKNYKRTSDATVPNGDEIAPVEPFHNTKEEVSKFCGLCETMKDMGYHYNSETENASGQINLGLEYLDTKEAILNFYEIYGNCEELLYYISSEEGQVFRQTVHSSSRIKPISEIIGKRCLDEELTREDIIKLFNNDYNEYNKKVIKGLQYKKNSVCLRGHGSDTYRLEFRIPNGGCNYKTWIDNIRLYGKMLEVSKKLADIKNNDYLTEEEESLLNHKIALQNNDLSLEEKLVTLMNLLFKDDKIKKIYYNRFIATIKKIEKTKTDRYQRHYYSHEPGFSEVDFIDEYQSRFDLDYVDEKDKEESSYKRY